MNDRDLIAVDHKRNHFTFIWPLANLTPNYAIGIACLMFCANGWAENGTELLVDPLRTLPPIIANGDTLPNDQSPVLCPVQKDFKEVLVLPEAIDIALCNNPQLRSTWVEIKYRAAQLGEARSTYLPTISATATDQKTRTNYPGTLYLPDSKVGGQSYTGTANLRLFDFGGRSASVKSANSLLTASIASHNAAIQKTLVDLIQCYFDAQTAKATWEAKKESTDFARSTLATANRKADHGAVSRSDVLQATTAFAKAALDTNRALGDYRRTLAMLVYTMGISPNTEVQIATDDHDQVKLKTRDLNEWFAITSESHPAILAARAQMESAKQQIVSTKSDGLPTLDFSYNYYQNGYPDQGLSAVNSHVSTLGVTLTIPIFEGYARTYKIRGAEAQAEQAEAQLLDTEHNILAEVVKAHADALSSLDNLESSESLLIIAKDSVESSERRYGKGAADIVELLTTQAALADAVQERIRCLSEWRSARLRLLASAGLMGRDLLRNSGPSE